MLTKYRPSLFFEMFKDFDSFFERSFDSWGVYDYQRQSVKSSEDSDNFYCELVVPGFSTKDLKLEASDGELRLSAMEESKSKSIFLRTSVPKNVDLSKAHARYKSGVLTVVFPKTKLDNSVINIKIESE